MSSQKSKTNGYKPGLDLVIISHVFHILGDMGATLKVHINKTQLLCLTTQIYTFFAHY
jgi:hypothetical protein